MLTLDFMARVRSQCMTRWRRAQWHDNSYTQPALPTHLPASRPVEDSEEDESEYDCDEKKNDDVQSRRWDTSDSSDLESSEAECSDLD